VNGEYLVLLPIAHSLPLQVTAWYIARYISKTGAEGDWSATVSSNIA
jgi:hypothetical protein